MSSTIAAIQSLSVSISLIASGGIAALSIFNVPQLRSQPASRSLPQIRWLFSRGSHIFPQAAMISTAGFAYLAVNALAPGQPLLDVIRITANDRKVNGFLTAAALSISIGAFTGVMTPVNFELIDINKDKGGARSEESGRKGGEAGEFTDLSDPQEQTSAQSSPGDDARVKELLDRFSMLNLVRAALIGAGGVVGLMTALA